MTSSKVVSATPMEAKWVGHGLASHLSVQQSLILILSIFCGLLLIIAVMFFRMPPMTDADTKTLRWPTEVHHLISLSKTLSKYVDANFYEFCILFACVYLIMVSFCIPGSVFFNVIAGSLFNRGFAIVLALAISSIGACNCYALSHFIARRAVAHFFPSRLASFQNSVNENRDSLFWLMLSCRFTPLIPNWFINISSPIVGIPLHTFCIASVIGILPQTFVTVSAGGTLNEIKSISDIVWNWTSLALLLGLGLLALIPAKFAQRNGEKTKIL